jgi:hypothetical protein
MDYFGFSGSLKIAFKQGEDIQVLGGRHLFNHSKKHIRIQSQRCSQD